MNFYSHEVSSPWKVLNGDSFHLEIVFENDYSVTGFVSFLVFKCFMNAPVLPQSEPPYNGNHIQLLHFESEQISEASVEDFCH